jgi:hypothetical protein
LPRNHPLKTAFVATYVDRVSWRSVIESVVGDGLADFVPIAG